MRREGSPLRGLTTIVAKETADHLTSSRIWLVEGLILLSAGGAVYAAIGRIRDTVGEDPFLFLSLFTVARSPLPSFVSFLGFLVPLVAIALGFDSINTEHSRRTMSRILAQPIYRDALLLGKFLAGLLTLAIAFLTLWLLVIGLGLLLLGLPPGGEEVLRSFAFLIVTVAYGGVWLALAIMFSIIFRQPATSALAALAVWLLFSVFWGMLTPLITDALLGPATLMSQFEHVQTALTVSRVSPNMLFGEATLALLNPATRALGPIFFSQLEGAVMGTPLPFGQSLLVVWPQITGLIAAMIVLFTIAYVIFQRQEIRA
ncbi:MAG: ABC transporter permease [Rhodospirillaceae bacterium]|nr:ABC transporter permease [Rhodospirillaceae bacterium]